MTEIECPRCHRLDFGEEPVKHSCVECHWTIRPIPFEGTPYGFDVLIEVRKQSLVFDTEVRHYKGSEATARRRARSVPRFSRVLAIAPLNETAWLNAYGEGRM